MVCEARPHKLGSKLHDTRQKVKCDVAGTQEVWSETHAPIKHLVIFLCHGFMIFCCFPCGVPFSRRHITWSRRHTTWSYYTYHMLYIACGILPSMVHIKYRSMLVSGIEGSYRLVFVFVGWGDAVKEGLFKLGNTHVRREGVVYTWLASVCVHTQVVYQR